MGRNDSFGCALRMTIADPSSFAPALDAAWQGLGGVDTVIVGNNPLTEEGDGFASIEDSEEYKKAVHLRVEFAPRLKIRDLVTPSR